MAEAEIRIETIDAPIEVRVIEVDLVGPGAAVALESARRAELAESEAADASALAQVAAGAAAGLISGSIGNAYLTRAEASAALPSISNGAFVQVLQDETKGNSWAVYRMADGALTYLFSVAGTTDESVAATGVFFDSSTADDFTDLVYTPTAGLTVSGGSVAFSSATQVAVDLYVDGGAGAALEHCFDTLEVDATYTITSFPSAGVEAVFTGMLNSVGPHLDAAEIKAFPGSTDYLLAQIRNRGAALGSDGASASPQFTSPITVRSRYRRTGDTALHIVNYNGGGDRSSGMSLALVYSATSYEMPRMFSKPLVRFRQGTMTLTALKVSASYPNAKCAFIGDSLTQGRFASSYADAFPQRVRADYPGEVLVAGAPSATTEDWIAALPSVIAMKPRYAFVLLGVNDLTTSRTLSAIQADYTTIMRTLGANEIVPIALTVPPINDSSVPTLNTWIKAQGWRYIDIYPLLVGSGTALNASYGSGDGIHWNSAGNGVVYDAVTAYIAAQGL